MVVILRSASADVLFVFHSYFNLNSLAEWEETDKSEAFPAFFPGQRNVQALVIQESPSVVSRGRLRICEKQGFLPRPEIALAEIEQAEGTGQLARAFETLGQDDSFSVAQLLKSLSGNCTVNKMLTISPPDDFVITVRRPSTSEPEASSSRQANSPPDGARYTKVKALLLCWENELQSGKETASIASMQEACNHMGYEIETKPIPAFAPTGLPQSHSMDVWIGMTLEKFVQVDDAEHTPLLVYYVGHGVIEDERLLGNT